MLVGEMGENGSKSPDGLGVEIAAYSPCMTQSFPKRIPFPNLGVTIDLSTVHYE